MVRRRNTLTRRLALGLAHPPILDDLAVQQTHHPLGLCRDGRLVRHQHDGHALLVKLVEYLHDLIDVCIRQALLLYGLPVE